MSWDVAERHEFYTLSEVAEILRRTRAGVYRRLIRRRRLAHHQDEPGGPILVRHRDLMEYVDQTRIEADKE